MIVLNEPQVWTLIGVFAASMFGMLGLMSTWFMRVMNANFEGIGRRFESIEKQFENIDRRFESIDKRFENIDRRFESIDKRFDEIDKRFEAQNAVMTVKFEQIMSRLDRLERDVQSLFRRVFPEYPDAS